METDIDPSQLARQLGSKDEAVRKGAAFKLQTLISDPSFADVFAQSGGLVALIKLALEERGNTLSYGLASLSNLLALDQGWESITEDVVDRLVELVASNPVVNVLRGAMAILAAVISHPGPEPSGDQVYGFSAVKSAIDAHPEFLQALVARLTSADHNLCLNALQLINALMRDSMTKDSEMEWPKFVKKLQELGVIRAVHALMQDATAIQDLAHALLDFQILTKVLLRKWREVPVDLEKQDHRRALKSVYLAAHPERRDKRDEDGNERPRTHDPEKWRRLGFQSESPDWEFEDVGFLGMMDLTDFARKSEERFQNLLLEQASQDFEDRCPIARSSLAVSCILYDHFDIHSSDMDDEEQHATLDARSKMDTVFKPLLLQWSRLHTCGVQAFMRLWATTGAKSDDFGNIEELVRILIETVCGWAPRTREIAEIELEMSTFELDKLRSLQMELLEMTHDDAWGPHLDQIKDELHQEALQFIKEQRIRCLLEGSWFPNPANDMTYGDGIEGRSSSWRYVKLSHNRRYLHYDDFDAKALAGADPSLEALEFKLDLNQVTSVVSNVTANSDPPSVDHSATNTLHKSGPGPQRHEQRTNTNIIIQGRTQQAYKEDGPRYGAHRRTQSSRSTNRADLSGDGAETALLTLNPTTQILASEWFDGLLLLLNYKPVTTETIKLIKFIEKYGMRIRLLNVRFDDSLNGLQGAEEMGNRSVEIPTRDGVDDEFFYDIGGV